MAEAVGFAASILQLVAAAAKFSEFILLIRNVPVEIARLHNQVNDVRLVLEQVKEAQVGASGSCFTTDQFATLIQALQVQFRELEVFKNEVVTEYHAGRGLKRLRWLSHRQKAKTLTKNLARVKTNLALSMATTIL